MMLQSGSKEEEKITETNYEQNISIRDLRSINSGNLKIISLLSSSVNFSYNWAIKYTTKSN
jgi:hypothetical protein